MIRSSKGHKLFFQIAETDGELLEAKRLDDLAFGEHHGISMDELVKVREFGAVILLRLENTNLLVGESQIIFHPIEELPYQFSHPVGFCYGTGIRPDYQRCGLGKILANQQETLAWTRGKNELQLTVRVENYASLKMRMDLGFEIFDYQPDFYGSEIETCSRVFMKKTLDEISDPGLETFFIFIPVVFGDKHDPVAHEKISEALAKGLQGKKIDRRGIYFA
jgi:ribosomal protein S18 acetylase RimI-like enzyme